MRGFVFIIFVPFFQKLFSSFSQEAKRPFVSRLLLFFPSFILPEDLLAVIFLPGFLFFY